jgi:hypothetical protein
MAVDGTGTRATQGRLPRPTAAACAILFALAFGFYNLAWRQAPVVEGDSPQYLEVARDLSDGSIDALHDRTIGYPLLLVITGSAVEPSRALFETSLLLHLAAVWLLAIVLHRSGARPPLVLSFAVLGCLPVYAETAGYVMTENLAQFTLAAGLAALVLWLDSRRITLLAAASLAFAFSALTRPANQALTPALALCLLGLPWIFGPARFAAPAMRKAAVTLVAGSLVILGAVAAYNRATFGFTGITPSFGFHLSTKTTPFLERLPERYAAVREILIRERDAELVKRGGPHSGTQAVWSVREELSAATGLSTVELSKYLVRMNATLIMAAPLEYLQEVARSLATYWLPAPGPLAALGSRVLRWCAAAVHLLVVGVLFLELAVLGGGALLAATRRIAAGRAAVPIGGPASRLALGAWSLALAIVAYTMAISCVIDIGEPRQRKPTDLLILFLCVMGLHLWARAITPGGRAESSPTAPRG